MLARIRARLTYSNVMSTLAVFIALGGGTAYAVDEWNGSNIQDETLTGADIQGSAPTLQQDAVDGTLETWDIKNGSIYTVDIADETLGPDDIARVTGAEVGTDALDGSDIQNLTGSDIADDSLDGFDIQNLSGLDVIDGSIGPADLAPDARNFREFERRSRTRSFPRGDLTITVNCQPGWTATGGGYRQRFPSHLIFVGVNEPTRDGRGWTVSASWQPRRGEGDNRLTAYALCAR